MPKSKCKQRNKRRDATNKDIAQSTDKESDDNQHDAHSTDAIPKSVTKKSEKKTPRKMHPSLEAPCEEAPFSTKLRYAVESCDKDAVCAILLSKRTFADVQDSNGDTSLHVAIRRNYKEIVVMLLLAGADTRVRNSDGRTPLHIALCHKQKAIADILLIRDSKNDVQDRDGNTPLHIAAKRGYVKVMNSLVAAGANISLQNNDGNTPLHIILSGKEEIVLPNMVLTRSKNHPHHPSEETCSENADDDDDGVHFEFFKGCVPDDIEESCFEFLCFLEPISCKIASCWYYKMEGVAKVIVDIGSANNVQDKDGDTPLHLASRAVNKEIVRELLLHGVSTQVKNAKGFSPLEEALKAPGTGMAKIIISACALGGTVIDWKNLNADQNSVESGTELWAECEAEIQQMKDTQVGQTCVSFYDVATEPLYQLAVHLRNEDVRKVLLQEDTETGSFDNYGELIASKVERAEVRRILSDQCLKCFSVVSRKLPSLPVTGIDAILTFLSEQDIKNFVEAFK